MIEECHNEAPPRCACAISIDSTYILAPSGEVLETKDGTFTANTSMLLGGKELNNKLHSVCKNNHPPNNNHLLESSSSHDYSEVNCNGLHNIPSFDYSHFQEEDMISLATSESSSSASSSSSFAASSKSWQSHNNNNFKKTTLPSVAEDSVYNQKEELIINYENSIFYGIPSSLKSLANINVTKLTAHPLGSHVLLISDTGLLFSFGTRNDHGQLGNGTYTANKTPSIITPILEGGGKAIDCAAGVTHSLVVVNVDGKRVSRRMVQSPHYSRSISPSPSSSANTTTTTSVGNHSETSINVISMDQMYAFGRNDHMKLGLINPCDADVLLPRRVALYYKFTERNQHIVPRCGIIAVRASLRHSVALIRPSKGGALLYAWGCAGDGALGHANATHQSGSVPIPTKVNSLCAVMKNEKPPCCPLPLHHQKYEKYAEAYNNSPTTTFRKNLEENLMNASNISSSSSRRPTINASRQFFAETIIDVVIGPTCTVALTSKGNCYSFGRSEDGLLGLDENIRQSFTPRQIKFPATGGVETQITSLSIGESHSVAISKEGKVYGWGSAANGQLGVGINNNEEFVVWKPRVLKIPKKVACAAAGVDSTVIIGNDGSVSSFGRPSGKLGQGDTSYVSKEFASPRPMYGGLYLWK